MDKRALAFIFALALLGGSTFFRIAMPTSFHIDETRDPLFETFPKQLGEWQGEDSVLDERVYEILETRNVLSRMYKNPAGDMVHLLLVSSSKDRRVAHPPEVCYLGSNFTITNKKDITVQAGDLQLPAKEFIAHSEQSLDYKENVLYLYKVGDKFTANYYQQQIQFALDQLAKESSRILLIRLAGQEPAHYPSFLTHVLEHIE